MVRSEFAAPSQRQADTETSVCDTKAMTRLLFSLEFAAELEIESRLPTGEYTPPDTTQLDS